MPQKKTRPVVVDLLGAFISSFVPPRGTPTDYGVLFRTAGVTAVNVTLGLYATSIHPVLRDIYDCQNMLSDASDRLIHVLAADDIEKAHADDKVGVIMGIQGLDFIGSETPYIQILSRLGLRAATLTYNEQNQFGAGCMEFRDNGLTLLGLRVIQEMNRNSVLVDVSHAGDRTCLDIVAASSRPVAATHSNARALVDSPRNLADEQIKAIAARGGIIGISPYSPFCSSDGQRRPNVADVMRHFQYVASLVGPEHVGLGSDMTLHSKIKWENNTRRMYPGMTRGFVFETLYAEGLADHDDLAHLPQYLQDAGFSREETVGILSGNALRLLRQVWAAD